MMSPTEFIGVIVDLPRCTQFANAVEAFKGLIDMAFIFYSILTALMLLTESFDDDGPN